MSTSISLSALSPADKQRLYDALDYSESVEGNQDYPKEVRLYHTVFELNLSQMRVFANRLFMAFCEFQYVKYELLFSMEKFEVRLVDELRRYHYHQII